MRIADRWKQLVNAIPVYIEIRIELIDNAFLPLDTLQLRARRTEVCLGPSTMGQKQNFRKLRVEYS